MKFTYHTGERPLEGFTLKRGIGQGGFGEVYFAISDGGKLVALKLLRNHEDIELRGVEQCLNLKHPHLVDLYDLRIDGRGRHWVVMEYVHGESLSDLLGRHPKGLPEALVQEWFPMIAKAVAYLHDHGVVHRDLKPGNIFLEDGHIKVGDYGLSKPISTSQGSAQTQSVGTVHYMAPEISSGIYNKTVDVYAAGIILYEMLSGEVPFVGHSAMEIMMKHMTDGADTSQVLPDYAPIITKALAKDPLLRYHNVSDMTKAVEAMKQANIPIAAPVGTNIRTGRPKQKARLTKANASPNVSRQTAQGFVEGHLRSLCNSLVLSVVFALIGVALWSTVGGEHDMSLVGSTFFLTVASCWAILIPSRIWTERLPSMGSPTRKGDPWRRRLSLMVLGGFVGILATWLDGWSPWTMDVPSSGDRWLMMYRDVLMEVRIVSFFALGFLLLRWWRFASRRRKERFSFQPLLGALFWGLALTVLLRPASYRGLAVLALTAVIVQLASPWLEPETSSKRVRLRDA